MTGKPGNSRGEASQPPPMSDKPKDWPRHRRAAEARDLSAEHAQECVRQILLALPKVSEPEALRALAIALHEAMTILRLLEGQGAPTRPQ